MKIVIFSPHGVFSPAHATTYMMLRYLSSLCYDVTQLHCNGAFSVCERDVDLTNSGVAGSGEGTLRTIEHCLQCSSEQRNFSDFSGAQLRKVTDFLIGEDLQATRQWVLERSAEELWNEEWYGLEVSNLIGGTFQRFCGEPTPRFKSQKHAGLVRQLTLASIRMALAGGKCINQMRPDWLWIPSGEEMLTKALYQTAKMRASGMQKMQMVRFQAVLDGQMVLAQREGDPHPYRVQNVIDTLLDVRSDIDTWPREVLTEFDEFFRFLGMSNSQLSLPVAR
ncbi:MAG: hypothetical protein KDD70_00935 [Bdellovibrionales bacterium]|nr:hypothetical protein [Bdellovibrionales bacterium]